MNYAILMLRSPRVMLIRATSIVILAVSVFELKVFDLSPPASASSAHRARSKGRRKDYHKGIGLRVTMRVPSRAPISDPFVSAKGRVILQELL